jgi:chromosome segregation ATPase
MDLPTFPRSDPLIVLLNEIDSLLAQTRSMELHVQRAQALAGDKIARLQEEYQRDVAALRAALAASEEALAAQKNALGGEYDLRQRIASLEEQLGAEHGAAENTQNELAETRGLVSSGDERLRAALDRATAFEQRMAELEAANNELATEIGRRDDTRRWHEDEIEALRHQVAAQERTLIGRREAVTAVELALHDKLQTIHQELANSRRQIEERDRAIERIEDAREALRRDYENEKAARLSAKDQDKERLAAKIAELQMQLAETQLLAERRGAEIADLKAAAGQLSEERARQQAGARAANAEQIENLEETGAAQRRDARNAFHEIHREEHIAMKTEDHEAPKSADEIADQAAQSGPAPVLSDEIARLRQEAQERNQILQDRNDELVRVKAQLDQLHERLAQLEAPPSSREENSLEAEAERMRTEFQAQLALLQAELSQKEWAAEELQAKARGLEQSLRQEIDALRRALGSKESSEPRAAREFVFDAPRPNHREDDAFAFDVGAEAAAPPRGSFASQRRWQTGFGWKRRWRS